MKLLILLVGVTAAAATSISGSSTENDAVERVMRAVSEHCAAGRKKRAAMDSEDKVRNLILSVVKDCLEQEYMPGPEPEPAPTPYFVHGKVPAGPASEDGLPVAKKVEKVMAAVSEHCAGVRRKRSVSPSSEAKVRRLLVNALGRCLYREPPKTTPPPMGVCQECQDCYKKGYRVPGIYAITPNCGLGTFEVWCDFVDYKGWTVLQKRYDGSVDFTHDWNGYKNGFGSVDGEHWLGNDKMHCLTALQGNVVLNIEVQDPAVSPSIVNGTWQDFVVSSESDSYRLTVSDSGYYGYLDPAQLTYSSNMQFSTPDNDNDVYSGNCADIHLAGWWYNSCQYVHLTGVYGGADLFRGFRYYTYSEQLRASVMRVTSD